MGSFKGTVTRNSNGSVEIAPFDTANPPRELAMGNEVEITFNVIRTVDEIQAATDKSKNRPAPAAATSQPATASPPANGESGEQVRSGRKTTTNR